MPDFVAERKYYGEIKDHFKVSFPNTKYYNS